MNNGHIVTKAGDVIFYQGNALVIYNTNTWGFTWIGKIASVMKKQLLEEWEREMSRLFWN